MSAKVKSPARRRAAPRVPLAQFRVTIEKLLVTPDKPPQQVVVFLQVVDTVDTLAVIQAVNHSSSAECGIEKAN
jgi:hypothetical protein